MPAAVCVLGPVLSCDCYAFSGNTRCNIILPSKPGKAVTLQARSGLQGSRKLRFPDFVTTQDGCRFSALRPGRLYPQKIFLVLISGRGCVYSMRHSAIGRITSMKNPLTAGIEPATFLFVAQHLNHCAAAVPRLSLGLSNELLLSVCALNPYSHVSPSLYMSHDPSISY